jgi:anti-anti-sigma regulatory factor
VLEARLGAKGMRMELWRRATFRYLCYGALFGALFPLTATIVDVWLHRLPLTGSAILTVQATQPLHWMIDTAPFFLGLFAAGIGWRQSRLLELNAVLHEQNVQVERAIRRAEQAEEVGRLHAENAQLYTQTRQQYDALQLVHQRLEQALETIHALALPLIPVQHGVLVVPLIGSFDPARVAALRATLLQDVAIHGAQIVILDYTGVVDIDLAAVPIVDQTIQALMLLGVEAVFTGITPMVAQRLVDGPLSHGGLRNASDLAGGITLAEHLLSRTHYG